MARPLTDRPRSPTRRAMASGSPATWSGKFRSTSVSPSTAAARSTICMTVGLPARLGQKRWGAEAKELRRGAKRGKGMGSAGRSCFTKIYYSVKSSRTKLALPRCAVGSAEPDLRRDLRVRPDEPADQGRRRPGEDDQRPPQADGGLECPAARQSRGLHQLGAVRGEPDDDPRERPHAKARLAQVGPRRARPADRPGPMRPDDAGVLRDALRPRPPVPVPRG